MAKLMYKHLSKSRKTNNKREKEKIKFKRVISAYLTVSNKSNS